MEHANGFTRQLATTERNEFANHILDRAWNRSSITVEGAVRFSGPTNLSSRFLPARESPIDSVA